MIYLSDDNNYVSFIYSYDMRLFSPLIMALRRPCSLSNRVEELACRACYIGYSNNGSFTFSSALTQAAYMYASWTARVALLRQGGGVLSPARSGGASNSCWGCRKCSHIYPRNFCTKTTTHLSGSSDICSQKCYNKHKNVLQCAFKCITVPPLKCFTVRPQMLYNTHSNVLQYALKCITVRTCMYYSTHCLCYSTHSLVLQYALKCITVRTRMCYSTHFLCYSAHSLVFSTHSLVLQYALACYSTHSLVLQYALACVTVRTRLCYSTHSLVLQYALACVTMTGVDTISLRVLRTH